MSQFFTNIFTKVSEVFINGHLKLVETFQELPKSFLEALNHPSAIFGVLGLLILICALIKIRKVKLNTRTITMIAIAVALTTVLKMFKLFPMPYGGSVTMGSMIPILLLSLVYGTETGLLAGVIYGIIDLILGPYIIHPIQVLFDYPLPFMMLGLAGIFREGSFASSCLNKLTSRFIKHSNKIKEEDIQLKINSIIGIFVAITARFVCHFISGVVFFADNAEEMSPYLYSFLYNSSFLSAEFLICVVVLSLLPLRHLMKTMITNTAGHNTTP